MTLLFHICPLYPTVIYVTVVIMGTASELLASECPCIVFLRGDKDAVEAVSNHLRALSIETSPRTGCPAVVATVEVGEGTYILRMSTRTDPDYLREVTSSETVAVLIDAQVRDTLADLSEETERGDTQTETRPAGTSALPKARTAPPVDRTPLATERMLLTQALPEMAYTFDNTLWFGVKVSACATAGPLCIGVTFRYSHDDATTGVSEKYGNKRFILDVLLSAHLIMTWGKVVLCPGVGIGGGYYGVWVRMGQDHDEKNLSEHGSFRASLFVSLLVRVTERLYIEVLELSGALSLPRHQDTFPGDEANSGFTIVDPRIFLRAGIGLRYGLPFGS
jgi:hypothetical protein